MTLVLPLSLICGSGIARAKVRVVTTLPSFGEIAARVGGDQVTVTALTRGTENPHFVEAKPEITNALGLADLDIRAGLGLEDGWLPPLIVASRNSRIQEGGEGDLDASTLLPPREKPKAPPDPARGDVHPEGDPHFMLDPRNGLALAQGIADRLSRLDPAHAADYRKRAADFIAALKGRIAGWESQLRPLQGKAVVTYHQSWGSFVAWAGMVEAGHIEPKPGVPPSPEDVVALIHAMKQARVRLILLEPSYPKGTAQHVAAETGAKIVVLPTEVGGSPEAKTYEDIFDSLTRKLRGVM